jgi:hypothetical protein
MATLINTTSKADRMIFVPHNSCGLKEDIAYRGSSSKTLFFDFRHHTIVLKSTDPRVGLYLGGYAATLLPKAIAHHFA